MEKDRTELLRLQAVRRRDELAAAQTQTKPSQTARSAAQPPNSANGFEFSTQQIRMTATVPNRKLTPPRLERSVNHNRCLKDLSFD